MTENHQDWTSCEMHGHQFDEGSCTDCHELQEDYVRYPDVHVSLSGEDGNAFAIVGHVSQALRCAGVPAEEIKDFTTAAFDAATYDGLLQVVMRTVEVS